MDVSPVHVTLISTGREAVAEVQVRADDGTLIPDASVEWSSSDPTTLEVSPSTGAYEATVRALEGGIAWVRARVGSAVDSMRVNVHSNGIAYITHWGGISDHDISVIDLETDTIAGRITLGERNLLNGRCTGANRGISFGPSARHAYVVDGFSICVVDVSLLQEVAVGGGVLRSGSFHHMFDIRRSPDAGSLWVSSREMIAEIDPDGLSTRRVFPIGELLRDRLFLSIDLTPDGRTALVTNGVNSAGRGDSLHLIDLETGTLRSTGEVGPEAWDVAAHPDGELAYVTQRSAARVHVVDISSGAVSNSITVGPSPGPVAFTPDGRVALVGNGNGTVSVLDVDLSAQIAVIPVGDGPSDISLTPDGSKAYVSNFDDKSVSVIDMESLTTVATIPVAAHPHRIVTAR